ncbi:MAG: ATP-dependent helicase HrpB [Gemmatimonadales bacterium]
MSQSLPVEAVIPQLAQALTTAGTAVLVAEPGAGKTTVVPWRLLDAPWLGSRKIVMLEPRRVAARAAATRLAWHLGETVGETVGYRIRFDTRVSARTRIEVVTEGVLTRLIDDDPALEDYGIVIFDEFHERSLPGDLGLALTLQSRAILRPDLRLLVMSATLDSAAVSRLLGNAPVLDAPGRVYPVETRYRPARPEHRFEAHVAGVIREALADEAGDVLVFLPGIGEIRRVESLLQGGDPGRQGGQVAVLPLHGTLSAAEQDAALRPGSSRRVILATSIAETSLTVPGVRVVIDGGRIRVPRFSPRTGMSRLETVPVTRDSADQRRGRAGRTEPGVCYRLWSPVEELSFAAHRTPEILSADLTPLALDLAVSGVADAAELAWLDRPPEGALGQAHALLAALGAVDAEQRITPIGRAMASLAVHPRLARMIVSARDGGPEAQALAIDLAVLLSDRDPVRRSNPHELPDVDLRLRVEAVATGRVPAGLEIDRGAQFRLQDEIRAWRKRGGVGHGVRSDPEQVGRLLATAYPDRIAQRRAGQVGRFLLRNGRGAAVPPNQPLARADYLVAADLDDTGSESRVLLAAPIDGAIVDGLVREHGERNLAVTWDSARRSIRLFERLQLGEIVVLERQIPDPDQDRIREGVLALITREGLGLLRWPDVAVRLRERLATLYHADAADWVDVSDPALLESAPVWLGPAITSGSIDAIDLTTALRSLLSHEQQRRLDRLAPEHYEVPTGSRIRIDYSDPSAPVLPVRLQEMFGEQTTPRIADGRIPLTVHLLSPAGRPIQVTRDLAGFWRTSYFDVRKEMRGRYPRHEWPENPLDATPTRRAKRKS